MIISLDVQCEFGGDIEAGHNYNVAIHACDLGQSGFEAACVGSATFTVFYPNLSHASLLFMADQHPNDVYQAVEEFSQSWHSDWRRPIAVIRMFQIHDNFCDKQTVQNALTRLLEYLRLLGIEAMILNTSVDESTSEMNQIRMRRMGEVYEQLGFSWLTPQKSHYMVKFVRRNVMDAAA